MTVYLDFETQSEADLPKVGAWAYSEHPSTRIICACWAIDEGPIRAWWPAARFPPPEYGRPGDVRELLEAVASEEPVEAHNAAFEWSIWSNVMIRCGWPTLRLAQVRDTMAVACYYALPPALENLCRVLGLGGKDPEGGRLISKYSKLHLKTAQRGIPPVDHAKFVAYCKVDVEKERQAAYLLGELPEGEERVFFHDFKVATRGLALDLEGIEAATAVVDQRSEELAAEFRELTGLNPGQRDAVLVWLRQHGLLELEDLQADTIEELLEGDGLPQGDTRRALELRLAHSKAGTKKLDAMARQRGKDGRARFQTRYHGAVTGRNTGTGFQPLNLSRGYEDVAPEQLVRDIMLRDVRWLECLYGEPMEAVRNASRHWIVAVPGHRIMAGDFASIEAVVLACLAGEEWKVEAFRRKDPIYELTGCMVHQLGPGAEELARRDKKAFKDKYPSERHDGKTLELACGYQGALGAWLKFDSSGRYTDQQIVGHVRAWRELHPRIRAFWRELEDAAIAAVNYPGEAYWANGVIGFERVDGWLTMILPDDKRIWYWAPELRMAMPPWHKPLEDDDCASGKCECEPRPQLTYLAQKEGRWRRVNTYGGKLCLAAETLVLTDRGWVAIVDVQADDVLWDGQEWVYHGGVVCQGVRSVISLEGVGMTPDHLVLTEQGWRSASQSEGHHRAACRLPHGDGVRWEQWSEVPVEGAMRLRRGSGDAGNRIGHASPPGGKGFLWLPKSANDVRAQENAWHVPAPGIRGVAGHEGSLFAPCPPSLGELWGARYSGLRALGRGVREFLGRHGGVLRSWPPTRTHQQRRELRARELPLDDAGRPGAQPPEQRDGRDPARADDSSRCFARVWGQEHDAPLAPKKRLAARASVYDIADTGPRKQFVVRGENGRPLIVHNCENATQAVSRQLLKPAELAAEAAGYPVVLSVYDEIVCEVPRGHGSTIEFRAIMEALPDWAGGWPIRAEVWEGERYRK